MIEIDLNPDHEHNAERTAHTADVLSDCVRILNYATEKGGLPHAYDGYRLLGELREAAWREAELLDRLSRWARVQAHMGAWEVDDMGPAEEIGPRLTRAVSSIEQAREQARMLNVHLTDAQNALSRFRNVPEVEEPRDCTG